MKTDKFITPPQNLINWFIDLPLELKIKLYNHWQNTTILGLEANYTEILKEQI